jgi:hypothetical protein
MGGTLIYFAEEAGKAAPLNIKRKAPAHLRSLLNPTTRPQASTKRQ